MMNNKGKVVDVDPDLKKGISINALEGLLEKWQEKLLLQDWDISLRIVDFQRDDYRQSGDFNADLKKKKAEILMTWDPWRGDEEYTLVHELVHLFLWDFDHFNEEVLLKYNKYCEGDHGIYLGKLEETVHKLTDILVGRPEKSGEA